MSFILASSIAVAATAGTWAAGLTAIVHLQERLIFGRPGRIRWAPQGPHGGHKTRSVELQVEPTIWLRGWLCEPDRPASHLVIWFGGRNENVGWVPSIASWLGPSWAICTFSYRGCGASDGQPSERTSIQDGETIVRWATSQTSVPRERALLIGRSLGSCVAMQVASLSPEKVLGLTLLSPPASVRSLARRNPLLLPATPWLRNGFDSLAAARRIHAPSLVLLAERDLRVPHSHSRRLIDRLRCAATQAGAPADRRQVEVATIAGTDHTTLARHPATLARLQRFAAGLTEPKDQGNEGNEGE